MAEAVPHEIDVPEQESPKAESSWTHDLKWASSLLLVAILSLAGLNNNLWRGTPEGREDLGRITDLLLGENALVFLLQLLGVLLVAALIASVVLAMRDPEEVE